MKVIDLINDLFDYREFQPDKLPKKIRFNNEEFVFKSSSYYNKNDINIMAYVNHTLDLRVEVEVLEEDKEIEKLGATYINFNGCTRAFKNLNDYGGKILANKIDEIINVVNELKKGK